MAAVAQRGTLARDWARRRRASPAELAGLGVESPLLAQLLVNRGLLTSEDAAPFLDPPRPVAPALDGLAGLPEAVRRIERALDAGEKIVVYGDYDVDGLSGSTILQRALLAIGARVEVFIPHRDRDGYGLNTDVLHEPQRARPDWSSRSTAASRPPPKSRRRTLSAWTSW